MALATFEDANAWLDGTRIKFDSDSDAAPEAKSADDIIKGRLYDVYPEVVLAWGTEGNETPQLIRTIAGMLMASYRYARKYSAESVKKDSYSSWLQAMAYGELDKIASGDTKLIGVVLEDGGIPVGTSLSRDDFYPNAFTGVLDPAQGTKFTIRDRF